MIGEVGKEVVVLKEPMEQQPEAVVEELGEQKALMMAEGEEGLRENGCFQKRFARLVLRLRPPGLHSPAVVVLMAAAAVLILQEV